MEPRPRAAWIAAGAVAAAGVAAASAALAIMRGRRADTLGPDGVVDSNERSRNGSPADRGKGGRVAIDVDRLGNAGEELEPTVEYLTYIQSKRGETGEHILFVRTEDIDALAALEGEEPEPFLERLQHLGVVISIN